MAKKQIEEPVAPALSAEEPKPDFVAVKQADGSALYEFIMPSDNTCAKCAAEIMQGDPVFAANLNQVVAGQGICKKCAG